MSDWPRVGVFGAGAVGCYFGARLAMAGAPVTLVGREAHVAAIGSRGLLFESGGQTATVRVDATTDPAALRDAQLVLFCVKSRDTDDAARTVARWAPRGATVLSMQNGVDNVARMREAAGLDPVAAVVYVGCSMAGPGHVRHAGRGDLVVGEVAPLPPQPSRDPMRVRAVADAFGRAGVPCRTSDDVRVDLWVKLTMNCVFNAASALARATYGSLVADEALLATARDVVDECVSVAGADGVSMPDPAGLFESAVKLGRAMASATSSTAQDLAAGRPTEIDSLNGYVARRAQALGAAAPVNRALAALVRLAERADA